MCWKEARVAFLGLFDGCPMPAFPEHCSTGPAETLAHHVNGRGRGDWVFLAGHQEHRTGDPPGIDGPRLGERLAGRRIAFRILPHQALAYEGDRGKPPLPRFRRETGADDRIRYALHAFRARPFRPFTERIARRRRGLENGAEQHETGGELRGLGGNMLADDGSHRMADENRPTHVQNSRKRHDTVGEELD